MAKIPEVDFQETSSDVHDLKAKTSPEKSATTGCGS